MRAVGSERHGGDQRSGVAGTVPCNRPAGQPE